MQASSTLEFADVLAFGIPYDRLVRLEDALQLLVADCAHGHKQANHVRHLENKHERVLLAAPLRLRVEVHPAFVRDAMAIAHYEVLLLLAAGAREDALSWRLGCVHHVDYAS